MNDVLARTDRGDVVALESIARFLYSNIGNVTNVDTIARTLGIGNAKAGRYVRMLEEAFLVYGAERYDIVGKRDLKTNGKFYASDLSLRSVALRGAGTADISKPLENIVYMELVRRGYTVHVGSYRDREVDFTALRAGRTEYFQVCRTMLAEDTRARELSSLRGISDNFPKTVLTLDTFGLGSEDGIVVVNVIDWLLERRTAGM